METTRLSTKGQVILPKMLREARGWGPGTEFAVEDVGIGILLRPLRPYPETRMEEVVGCTGYAGPRRSLEEMDAAVAAEARDRR